MIFRLLFAFVVISAATAGFMHLALFTNYFKNGARLQRIAKTSLVLAVGGLLAIVTLFFLVLATS